VFAVQDYLFRFGSEVFAVLQSKKKKGKKECALMKLKRSSSLLTVPRFAEI